MTSALTASTRTLQFHLALVLLLFSSCSVVKEDEFVEYQATMSDVLQSVEDRLDDGAGNRVKLERRVIDLENKTKRLVSDLDDLRSETEGLRHSVNGVDMTIQQSTRRHQEGLRIGQETRDLLLRSLRQQMRMVDELQQYVEGLLDHESWADDALKKLSVRVRDECRNIQNVIKPMIEKLEQD